MLVFLSVGFSIVGGDAIAQVSSDLTLSSESSDVSIVTTDGSLTYRITGGASRGGNLFHSFDQFSVPAGDTAEFVNADSITNIISRVTGNNISELNGTIQVGGSANLFLINPAGIVIGPNARLNIGGSFIASTGEGLLFDDGFVYGVDAAEMPPLLTVNAPIGINLGNTPGDIAVVGDRVSSSLSVAEGQTLALIGGNISLTGTQLRAPGGRIELGSVNQAHTLSLTPTTQGFDVGFEQVNGFGDIQLNNRSVLNASGTGGGAIALHGSAVTFTEQSALISDTLGNQDGLGIRVTADSLRLLDSSFIGATTLGSGAASSIAVTAAEDIEIIGTGIPNYKFVELSTFLGTRQISDRQIGGIATTTVASGRTGDISLNTQRLVLDEGVLVSTESFGTGDSGTMSITATDLFSIGGSGILGGSRVPEIPLLTPQGTPSGLSTNGIPAGSGGSIDISTARLVIKDNGVIAVGTQSDQDSGTLAINATESVILRGTVVEPYLFPTQITTISLGGDGAAGDIQITTKRLALLGGSLMFADSGVRTIAGNIPFGGPAGNVTIVATESVDIQGSQPLNESLLSSTIRSRTFTDASAGTIQISTPRLTLRDGGQVTSATLNEGSGGAINIDAQNIVISGAASEDADSISGIFANSGVETLVAFSTGEIESVPASGSGGTITITTTNLIVEDKAEITVGSFDTGSAGNLDIIANVVRLDNRGSLSATASSDGGGNITLTSDSLALDSSSITASSASSNGGNLSFNLGDILLLRDGSLISTEAGTAGDGGDGGDITLNLPDGFIVAVPNENSDIRANAFEGDGGSVNVTARSLIGIAFRPNVLDTPLSDIAASSRFGNSGTVIINELAPDMFQDGVTLPNETAPPALAQGCRARGAQTGSFVITGRGGLPTNPADLLSADSIWQDLAPLSSFTDGNAGGNTNSNAEQPPATEASETATPDEPIVEAHGWIRTKEGTVMLVADAAASPDSGVPMGC